MESRLGFYLNGPIGQVHDDRLGGPDPPLDLRDGHVGAAGSDSSPASSSNSSSCSSSLDDLPSLPALGEVLVHVLGEVAEQGELLVEGLRHLAAAHRGQVVPLAKLDKPRKTEIIDCVCLWWVWGSPLPSICGVADTRVIIKEHSN